MQGLTVLFKKKCREEAYTLIKICHKENMVKPYNKQIDRII